jgi:hypothetical protein
MAKKRHAKMSKEDRWAWISEYICDKGSVDILNAFVEAYQRATGASIVPKLWGANYCPLLSKDLGQMAAEYRLRRRVVTLREMGMGFPSWVWHYSM